MVRTFYTHSNDRLGTIDEILHHARCYASLPQFDRLCARESVLAVYSPLHPNSPVRAYDRKGEFDPSEIQFALNRVRVPFAAHGTAVVDLLRTTAAGYQAAREVELIYMGTDRGDEHLVALIPRTVQHAKPKQLIAHADTYEGAVTFVNSSQQPLTQRIEDIRMARLIGVAFNPKHYTESQAQTGSRHTTHELFTYTP